MKHTWYKCVQPCDRPGCPYCEGGLGLCTVCGGLEGTLTTDCCGRQITPEEEHLIYREGTLDFKNGKWVIKKPMSPAIKDLLDHGVVTVYIECSGCGCEHEVTETVANAQHPDQCWECFCKEVIT